MTDSGLSFNIYKMRNLVYCFRLRGKKFKLNPSGYTYQPLQDLKSNNLN